jgi:hypothetical protein
MSSKYLPYISSIRLDAADNNMFFDLLVQPLHEELYRRQNFNFLDDLSAGQQLFLSYDYVQQQVSQGGFIQFLQNGYVSLLLPMPGWLTAMGADSMAQVIDDVLKSYVIHIDKLDKETTVQEFARLYEELPEFNQLDERFRNCQEETIVKMLAYAKENLDEFARVEYSN